MSRILVHCACPVLALFLVGNVVLAGDCKQIKANVGSAFYPQLADCPATQWPETEIGGCIETPVQGNLKGTWVYYWPAIGNFFEEVDPAEGHPGFAAFVAFSVFRTNHGEMWTRDATILDMEHLAGFEFFTQTSVIVGGTGAYQDASGRLGYVGSEIQGILSGEVCTP